MNDKWNEINSPMVIDDRLITRNPREDRKRVLRSVKI